MIKRVFPVLAATLLVACGGASEPEAAPVTDAPAAVATTTTVPMSDAAGSAPAPAALQFTAPLVGGGEIELGELAGRPVLLWFWAPW